MINIVLAFTLATILVVVIAPLFGYKFDLIMTSLNDLAASDKALTNPEVVEPTYGGYSGFTDPQSQAQGYRALPGGSLTSLGVRILNRSGHHCHCLQELGGTNIHRTQAQERGDNITH